MSKESDTERNGPFSYYGEWHSFTIGVYSGLVTYKPWGDNYKDKAKRYDDVDNEPWYYKGGYVLGTILQLTFIVIVLWAWSVYSP